MTVLTEGFRNAEFLISEANMTRSREEVVVRVPAGETYLAGMVLMITSSKYVARTDAGTDAKGILYEHCDNSESLADADFARTVINCDAEVQGETMDANGGTEALVLAELLVLGIKVRGDLANVAT